MSKAFTNEIVREREIREALLSILAAADLGYVKSVNLGRFEQGLIDEVQFILPGDDEDMQHVVQYVHAHGEELYRIALTATV